MLDAKRLVGVVGIVSMAACMQPVPHAEREMVEFVPPRMVVQGPTPELRAPRTNAGRTPLSMKLEVRVDSLGRPDMTTFRLNGFGSSENREVLTRWVEGSMFEPARRNGHAVPAVFQTKLERTIVRRG